jgi:hypothetical protein
MKPRLDLPHPAIILDDCPQLASVIAGMEAGDYPLPDFAVWREDLPMPLRVRLAKATGATDAQIAIAPTLPAEDA